MPVVPLGAGCHRHRLASYGVPDWEFLTVDSFTKKIRPAPYLPPMHQIVVIGDVHHHLWLAVDGLRRIEAESGRSIDQVFSVGDLGLFLDESDWAFLTGPSKYRRPEDSKKIREAWEQWRWPLSAIAGNHEPFNRLRDWDAAFFSFKMEYTDAGELVHSIPGLRVAGLSGIFQPEETDFVSAVERSNRKLPRADSWPDMVAFAESNRISRSRLTYYKEFEVERLKSLDFAPHLLLLHDWPVSPEHISERHSRRPEAEIVRALNPEYVCCGHHHTSATFDFASSTVHALNIVTSKTHSHLLNPGWTTVFDWDGSHLINPRLWPQHS